MKELFQDLPTLPQAISEVFYLEEEIKEDYGKTVLKIQKPFSFISFFQQLQAVCRG